MAESQGCYPTRFLVVGTYRTGSTVIGERCRWHPQIVCGWEWSKDLPWYQKSAITRRALEGDFSGLPDMHQEHMKKELTDDTQALGFRWLFRPSDKYPISPMLSPALWLDRLHPFLQQCKKDRELKIIHVVRKNQLEWLRSVYLAKQTGAFTGKRYPEGLQVHIPPAAAVRRLRAKNYVDKQLSVLADSNPYLQVQYEHFSSDPEGVTAGLHRFLGFDPYLKKEGVRKKQATRSVEEDVSNYRSLTAMIEQAKQRGKL